MSARLQVEGWEIYAGGRRLVHLPALDLPGGQLWVLRAPSGGGKSVLLRSFTGLLRLRPGVQRGQLRLQHLDLKLEVCVDSAASNTDLDAVMSPVRGRHLTWVPPWGVAGLDPLQRVGGQSSLGLPYWQALELAPELLARRPSQLSEGQARRVLVAAGLGTPAGVLLLDEPTEGLDPLTRQRLWRVLRREADQGRALLVATHDERPPADGQIRLELR